MRIFSYDGGIMKALSKFTDCIALSLLFLVSCIPIFTIGTAAAAMYYTAYKVLRHDRGYLFREYVAAFRENFRQTTPVWLLALGLGVLLGIDGYIMFYYAGSGSLAMIFGTIFTVGMIVWYAWISYLFPYMSRFENTRKQSMKNALLFTAAHLPTTVLVMALTVLVAGMFWMVPFLIILLPAFYSWLECFLLERVFRKYMTEEQRREEDEKNRKDFAEF